MHEAVFVDALKAQCCLVDDRAGIGYPETPKAANHFAQIETVDVFHHQVRNFFAVADVGIEVVRPHDVRMIERRDRAGLERVMNYMTRCPFSLSRPGVPGAPVKVTASGEVVYKAEKDACRAFPDPQGDGLTTGPKRNFQVLSPLDFLAEFTQHIPPKGAHLVRYYGWYSNKARGMRRKAAAAEAAASNLPSPSGRGAGGEGITKRASQTWAMLIKRVYEIDPLCCAKRGGQMKAIPYP